MLSIIHNYVIKLAQKQPNGSTYLVNNFKKVYSYFKHYKADKIEVTKNIYNTTIYTLIDLLYKITYTNNFKKPRQPSIEFNEECVFY